MCGESRRNYEFRKFYPSDFIVALQDISGKGLDNIISRLNIAPDKNAYIHLGLPDKRFNEAAHSAGNRSSTTSRFLLQ